MDSSKIKIILIVVVAMFFAIYLGVAAATAQLEALAWVVAVAGSVFVLALGRHIWMLIPISLGFAGTINAVPGSPAVWWVAMVIVLGMTILRFVMRTNELRFQFTLLDFAILLQVLVIGQAWLRHPAGFAIFGGESVGGKMNLTYAFAIVCYALQACVKTDLNMFKRVTLITIAVAVADGLLMLASERFPSIAVAAMPFYSGIEFTTDAGVLGKDALDLSTSRMVAGMQLGRTLGVAALTLFVPLSLVNPLRFGRFLLFSVAMLLVLLSGFRSILGMFAILFVVSSLIRRRHFDIIVAALVFPLLLSLIIVSGQVRMLPFGVQRVLSVLDVDVMATAREDGEKSSEWRYDMWRRALFTDRYIQNKLLGDGFGFRADEQRAAMDAVLGAARSQQGVDIMMSRGSFHGFHVEAIRFTGIVGLIAALISMGIFFRVAWQLIQYFRYRPEWKYVLYLCIPFLIHPFYYMLVFGSYKSGFPLILISAGMLKLLDNIRVRELADARAAAPTPVPDSAKGPAPAPERHRPPGRFPQPAMKSR